MKFLKKNAKIIIPVAVVILIVIVVVASRRNASQPSQYITEKVQRGELLATVGATGTVRSRQTADLVWQTNGTVQNVNVSVGDKVSRDEVLADLAPSSVSQNIILAEADLVSAQQALDDLMKSDTARAQAWIALRDAQDAYDTANNYRQSLNGVITIKKVTFIYIGGRQIPVVKYVKGYADENTIASADADLALKKAQLDDAQRAYDRLKDGPNPDDVAAAQARVDAAKALLNMSKLISPFDGVVTEVSAMPGDQVNTGSAGIRVDDLSSLLVDVQVSEVDINSVSVGQPVTLSFDAILGQTYHGEVTDVSQVGTPSSGVVNFTVTVKVTDADAKVKPGMTAAVTITVQQLKDQILIPNRAVRLVSGNRVVYVLRNGQPVKVVIHLGSSSDTMSVLASGDVKEGDEIILNPPVEFTPGGGPGGGGPFGG